MLMCIAQRVDRGMYASVYIYIYNDMAQSDSMIVYIDPAVVTSTTRFGSEFQLRLYLESEAT